MQTGTNVPFFFFCYNVVDTHCRSWVPPSLMLLSILLLEIEEDDYSRAINIENPVSIVKDLPSPSESMVVDEPTEKL